jgi:hypothetical protein
MRRSVVALLLLAMSLSAPAGVEAANNNQRKVTPKKNGKPKGRTARARVKPLDRGHNQGGANALGASRRAAPEPQYDEGGLDEEGFDEEYDDVEPEPRRAPAVRLGHAPGRRTSYRVNGMMAPAAPGYDGAPNSAQWTGAKAPLGKIGGIVVGTITVGVLAVAGTVFAATLGHNLPQLLGGLFGG